MKRKLIIILLIFIAGAAVYFRANLAKGIEYAGNKLKTGMLRLNSEVIKSENLLNKDGLTIGTRFKTPEGFERIEAPEGSFAEYIRNIELKPDGTEVKYFDGREKPGKVYTAVMNIDVGDRDLQQCADAVMRIRSEYLYKMGMYDKIKYHFVSGFLADYKTWMNGYRINVDGNNASWVKKAEPSKDYKSFRQYLDMVFAYASTVSLEKELKSVSPEDMQIGDVFIKGSLPGHIIIVVDMAYNKTTGEKLFMIAQGSTPAQDIHILKSTENKEISPWYSINFGDELSTPEWEFSKDQLMRFDN